MMTVNEREIAAQAARLQGNLDKFLRANASLKPYLIKATALKMAQAGRNATKRMSTTKFMAEMSQPRYKSSRWRPGMVRNKWQGTAAEAIWYSIERRKGPVPWGERRYRMLNAFIARRLNSRGYHRAGWIPAIEAFGKGAPAPRFTKTGRLRKARSRNKLGAAQFFAAESRAYFSNNTRGLEDDQPAMKLIPVREGLRVIDRIAPAAIRRAAMNAGLPVR